MNIAAKTMSANDVLQEMALGVHAPQPARACQEPSVADLQMSYAIAKQVPAMAQGFNITTSYGEIYVVAGPLADAIAELVRQDLEQALAIGATA